MPHPKQHITDLAEICFREGIEHVIISPGSRNAPLISAFVKRFGQKCISMVDERSAGYFALGLARYNGNPVALISTSGTAILNYGPSIAEAYYQHIPVLAITADRPAEWIDQQDNQTIRQNEVFKNFIKSSYQLPQKINSVDTLSRAHDIIMHAIRTCKTNLTGPVHLNVPIDEPLYEPLPEPSGNFLKQQINPGAKKDPVLPDKFLTIWAKAKRIMIIHGHCTPNNLIFQSIQKLSTDSRIVIIGENISNCSAHDIISNPEHLLANYSDYLELPPDVLIYSAGQVVSKRLKTYLRNSIIKETWRIGIDEYPIDTFRQNNQILQTFPGDFYAELVNYIETKENNGYKNSWLSASIASRKYIHSVMTKIPFCDLKAFNIIMESVPPDTILELGNSSAIRYSQLFKSRTDLVYYANRGVSGIDGCLSTACGTAYSSNKLTVSILGDLSFIYDSNALWNKHLPNNLRIIVLNNSGGDIFNLIEGSIRQPKIEHYLIAHHPVSIQKLAEAFNLDYFCSQDEQELKNQLNGFFNTGSRAALLEIKTPPRQNSACFRQAMRKRPSSEII